MGKRNVLLDAMRGMAIILVVLGHVGVCGDVRNWIYAFHMPLFFFISGYFCNDQKPFGSFLYKKVKTLYFPFVSYYVLFVVFSHLLHQVDLTHFDYSSLGDCLRAILLACRFRVGAMDLLGHFWFLPVLFFISVLFFGLLRMAHRGSFRNEFVLFGGAVFTLLAIVGKWKSMPNPYDIQRVFYYMGFYALGWYVAQKPITASWVRIYSAVVSFALLVLFSCSCKAMQWNPLAGVLAAVIGIVFSWSFCQEMRKNETISAFLSYIGKHTMPIFVWHVFCFKCLELLLAHWGVIGNLTVGWDGSYATNPFCLVLLYTSVGILLPIGFCKLKNKIVRI